MKKCRNLYDVKPLIPPTYLREQSIYYDKWIMAVHTNCIDALTPAKACDPWAVYSAKSFSKEDGSGVEVTEIQSKNIADIVGDRWCRAKNHIRKPPNKVIRSRKGDCNPPPYGKGKS